MADVLTAFLSMFTGGELAEIGANKIRLSDKTESDAIGLATAWASHIEKLDLDRALPRSDHRVWNHHDLAGALFLRDHVEDALAQLPPLLAERKGCGTSSPNPTTGTGRSRSPTQATASPGSRMSTYQEGHGGGSAYRHPAL